MKKDFEITTKIYIGLFLFAVGVIASWFIIGKFIAHADSQELAVGSINTAWNGWAVRNSPGIWYTATTSNVSEFGLTRVYFYNAGGDPDLTTDTGLVASVTINDVTSATSTIINNGIVSSAFGNVQQYYADFSSQKLNINNGDVVHFNLDWPNSGTWYDVLTNGPTVSCDNYSCGTGGDVTPSDWIIQIYGASPYIVPSTIQINSPTAGTTSDFDFWHIQFSDGQNNIGDKAEVVYFSNTSPLYIDSDPALTISSSSDYLIPKSHTLTGGQWNAYANLYSSTGTLLAQTTSTTEWVISSYAPASSSLIIYNPVASSTIYNLPYYQIYYYIPNASASDNSCSIETFTTNASTTLTDYAGNVPCGGNQAGSVPLHTPLWPGTYNLTIQVSDSAGTILAEKSETFTVQNNLGVQSATSTCAWDGLFTSSTISNLYCYGVQFVKELTYQVPTGVTDLFNQSLNNIKGDFPFNLVYGLQGELTTAIENGSSTATTSPIVTVNIGNGATPFQIQMLPTKLTTDFASSTLNWYWLSTKSFIWVYTGIKIIGILI